MEALEGHAAGTLRPAAQSAEGVTYAAKIEKAEALIDWTRDALEIERQVRAFNPWPVAETRLEGEQLRVFEAKSEGDSSGSLGDPGTIAAVRDDALIVQCGRGRLALRQVQRPGKRVVPAADFARGIQLTGRRLG